MGAYKTFTVRGSEREMQFLEALKEATRQRTASKAIWIAVRDYPVQQARIRALQRELAIARIAVDEIAHALRDSDEVAAKYAAVKERLLSGTLRDYARKKCWA